MTIYDAWLAGARESLAAALSRLERLRRSA